MDHMTDARVIDISTNLIVTKDEDLVNGAQYFLGLLGSDST